ASRSCTVSASCCRSSRVSRSPARCCSRSAFRTSRSYGSYSGPDSLNRFAMFIVSYRRIFLTLSTSSLAAAIGAAGTWGLRFGIEFTGGTLVDARYESERPAMSAVEAELAGLDIELGGFSLRPAGEDRYLLRTRALSESEAGIVTDALALSGEAV